MAFALAMTRADAKVWWSHREVRFERTTTLARDTLHGKGGSRDEKRTGSLHHDFSRPQCRDNRYYEDIGRTRLQYMRDVKRADRFSQPTLPCLEKKEGAIKAFALLALGPIRIRMVLTKKKSPRPGFFTLASVNFLNPSLTMTWQALSQKKTPSKYCEGGFSSNFNLSSV